MTTMTDADIERMRLAALASGTSITRITGDGKVEHIDPADFYVEPPYTPQGTANSKETDSGKG